MPIRSLAIVASRAAKTTRVHRRQWYRTIRVIDCHVVACRTLGKSIAALSARGPLFRLFRHVLPTPETWSVGAHWPNGSRLPKILELSIAIAKKRGFS